MATVTVGSDPSDDFTSLQAAIDSFTDPFVEPNIIQVRGELFDLALTTIELNVTTSAVNTLTIEPIPGDEQDYVRGNGPVFRSARTGGFGVFTQRNNCNHVFISGIQIESDSGSTLHCFLDFRTSIPADSLTVITNCYWYHSASQGGSPTIWRRQSNNVTNRSVFFVNCLFNTVNEGIQGDSGQNGNINCANITLIRNLTDTSNANLGIRYALVTDCAVFHFGPTSGFRDYLNLNGSSVFYAASDTTGSSASLDNLVLADQYTDPANDDWSLKAGNALAGAGSGGGDIGVITASGPTVIDSIGLVNAPVPLVAGLAASTIPSVGTINAPVPLPAASATSFPAGWLFLTLGVVDPDKSTRVDFNQPFDIAQGGRIAYDPVGGTVSIATDGRLTVSDPGATFQWAYDDGTGWSNFITSTVTFGEGDVTTPSPLVAGLANIRVDSLAVVNTPVPLVTGFATVTNNIPAAGLVIAPTPEVTGIANLKANTNGIVNALVPTVIANASITIETNGNVNAPSPIASGAASITITSTANIIAPTPVIVGLATVGSTITSFGNVNAPTPVVSGNASVRVNSIANVNAPSPIVSGDASLTIDSNANVNAPSPLVIGIGVTGDVVVSIGNVNAPTPVVSGNASVRIDSNGTINAPLPIISGIANVDAPIITSGSVLSPGPVVNGLATVTITSSVNVNAPVPVVVALQAAPITTPPERRAQAPASDRRARVID
jgi:hypothetical protein